MGISVTTASWDLTSGGHAKLPGGGQGGTSRDCCLSWGAAICTPLQPRIITGRFALLRWRAEGMPLGAERALWSMTSWSSAVHPVLWRTAYGSAALTPGRSANRAFASKVTMIRSVCTACAAMIRSWAPRGVPARRACAISRAWHAAVLSV